MTVLVDTNVLLDIVSNDPIWLEWSITRVREALQEGSVVIDAVIYAELSLGSIASKTSMPFYPKPASQ